MNSIIKNSFKAIGLACLFTTSLTAVAQAPMSLYYIENLPQSNFMNPAFEPRANGYVGFPIANSIYTSHQSDLSAKTFLQEDGDQWISPLDYKYNYDKLYRQIGRCANVNEYESVSPLVFGFRARKNYFTFAYSERVSAEARIPADMFKMVETGFPDGSNFDLTTLGVDVTYYREFSIGYSRQINNALTLGIHLKPIFGLAAIKFDMNNLELNTSLNEWNFNVDGNIYSSFPMDVYSDSEGKPDSVKIRDLDGDEIKKQVSNFSNPGGAVDLGAVYELNNKWSFSAAVNNLGFINWKSNLNSVSANGIFSFDGIDINYQDRDSIGQAFEDLADSLTTVVDAKAGNDKFRTYLTPVANIGARYQYSYTISFGFLSQTYFQKFNYRQNFNLSANVNLYRFLSASANYNINIKGVNNFGLGLALKGGPFQLYVLADHIPTRYSKVEEGNNTYIVPATTQNFNVMFGLNIIFGGKGFRDQPMIDSYKEY